MWEALGVLTIVLLIVFWSSRNAVWGGMTIGVIIGFIVTIFTGFDWYIIGKGAILGTIAGVMAELLGRVSDRMRK